MTAARSRSNIGSAFVPSSLGCRVQDRESRSERDTPLATGSLRSLKQGQTQEMMAQSTTPEAGSALLRLWRLARKYLPPSQLGVSRNNDELRQSACTTELALACDEISHVGSRGVLGFKEAFVSISICIEISVQGIDDAAIIQRIDAAIRTSLGQQPWPGTWRVAVAPSHAAGRWDVRIQGPAGKHVLSLAVPPRLLPDLIPRRLDESLNHAVACVLDAAAGGRMAPLRKVG
jgi:hypothetical protein